MNTHELNEDLLTRYVLGELTQEESLAVKEALLANPEARKTVAEIEATVGMLTEALGGEAVAAGLGDEAKEKITTEAQRHGGGKRQLYRWSVPLLMLPAACIFLVFGYALARFQFDLAARDLIAKNQELQNENAGLERRIRSAERAMSSLSALTAEPQPAVAPSPVVAGSPDPATAATEGLPTPQPEPLRYSQATPAEAAAAPSTPRTEADVAKAKKNEGLELGDISKEGDLQSAGVAGSETPSPLTQVEVGGQLRVWADSVEFDLTPKDHASTKPRMRLSENDDFTDSASMFIDSSELRPPDPSAAAAGSPDPAANAPAPPKPEPKKEAAPGAAASIQSTQSVPSMEQTRQIEALGYGTSNRDYRGPSGEQYNPIIENPFKPVANEPLSTFSIDVDTGSYANVRRFIEGGQLPPADAVRIEEMINYFDYTYPKQTYAPGADPFTAAVSVAACPWTPGHKLVRVGVQGAAMPEGQRPASNLVFLIDVSGSMDSPDKLPLVKQGLQMLVNQLGENDRVSMVVYAGRSGVALPPTNGSNRQAILDAIQSLESGGSTNGAGGITLAYQLARENFIEGGVNRVILATDGDFNVGISDQGGLIQLITEQAKSKVFLTVLGFGTGNLQDGMMEQLANKGNGMYAYIDSLREAKKVFVEQAEGSLITIAKDVKIQIEFNPARVQSYRLIGYENRALAAQDFNDDTKDAGEIGAGHTVTALYEIVPVGGLPQPGVDPLKYQKQEAGASEAGALPSGSLATSEFGGELMTLKLRYKQPEGDVSKLLEFPIVDSTQAFEQADADFRFASSVAAFGMLLCGSQHSGGATFDTVQGWAMNALGDDPHGYRAGFLDLVRKAGAMR